MSGGQTALTCVLAPGLHVCVRVRFVFWGVSSGPHAHAIIKESVNDTNSSQQHFPLTPHLSGFQSVILRVHYLTDLCNKAMLHYSLEGNITLLLHYIYITAIVSFQI